MTTAVRARRCWSAKARATTSKLAQLWVRTASAGHWMAPAARASRMGNQPVALTSVAPRPSVNARGSAANVLRRPVQAGPAPPRRAAQAARVSRWAAARPSVRPSAPVRPGPVRPGVAVPAARASHRAPSIVAASRRAPVPQVTALPVAAARAVSVSARAWGVAVSRRSVRPLACTRQHQMARAGRDSRRRFCQPGVNWLPFVAGSNIEFRGRWVRARIVWRRVTKSAVGCL